MLFPQTSFARGAGCLWDAQRLSLGLDNLQGEFPVRDLKLPDQRHPEKAHRPDQEQPKKPSWIRVKAPTSEGYKKTREILKSKKLVTVCDRQ